MVDKTKKSEYYMFPDSIAKFGTAFCLGDVVFLLVGSILDYLISDMTVSLVVSGFITVLPVWLVLKTPVEHEAKTGLHEKWLQQNKKTAHKPSGAWYLIPLFLGFVGGLIGYLVVKDDDSEMAESLLLFGIMITIGSVILTILYWSWILSLVGL